MLHFWNQSQSSQGYDYNNSPYENGDYRDVGRNGAGSGGYRSYQQPEQPYDYHPSSNSDYNNYDPHRYHEGSHSRGGLKPYSQGYGFRNDKIHPLEHFSFLS